MKSYSLFLMFSKIKEGSKRVENSLSWKYDEFQGYGIMLNKGWMIAKYYNEDEIMEKLASIIKDCIGNNDDDTYYNLCSYLRIQEE